MRGSVLSLSFVESKKPDKPDRPNEPPPRHAPRNVGLQALIPRPLFHMSAGLVFLINERKAGLVDPYQCFDEVA